MKRAYFSRNSRKSRRKIIAERPSELFFVFNECPLAPKAVDEAKFRLNLFIEIMAKDIITNHGVLLKVHDGHLK
jgi:hypothetical protein